MINPVILCFCIIVSIIAVAQDNVRLTEPLVSDAEVRFAKELTIAELKNRGFRPEEFYVVVAQSDEKIELRITHEEDLFPKNRNVTGSPSGKSQACEFSKL